jgi:RND family efflux transporter MFP subunit
MGIRARSILFVAATVLVVACDKPGEPGSGKAPPRNESPASPVTVANAVARRVEARLEKVGTLRSAREVTVRSEASGTVVEIAFEEGRPVHRGELLARLDTRKTEAEIQRLQAQILQLEARAGNRERELERNESLTAAEVRKQEERVRQLAARNASRQRDLDRNRDLLARELVSRQSYEQLETEIEETGAELAQAEIELKRQREMVAHQSADRLRTDLRETEAEIAQAQAALARERARLADATIRAPFDGIAGTRIAQVGDLVATGGEIVVVTDPDPLEIAFEVPERHKELLVLGLQVRVVVDAFPGRTFAGSLSYLSPRVDEQSRAFLVKAQVRNPGGSLNPGMFARVTLVTGIREASVMVPAAAVITAEGESSVFVVEGGAARRVVVSPGESAEGWVEVAGAGLARDAAVVVEGKYALRDGARVTVQQRAAPPSTP